MSITKIPYAINYQPPPLIRLLDDPYFDLVAGNKSNVWVKNGRTIPRGEPIWGRPSGELQLQNETRAATHSINKFQVSSETPD